MKKVILSLTLLLACGSTAFAQTENDSATVAAEMQKQLIDLKMSRKIIYADSYEGKKIYEQAKLRQRNQKKLEYMIHEFLVKDLGLSAQDAQELYDFVDDKLQNVERTIDGATVAHMFSWITKESLVSLVKKNNYDFKPIAEYMEHPERFELDEKLQEKIDGLKHNANFLENYKADETQANAAVESADADTKKALAAAEAAMTEAPAPVAAPEPAPAPVATPEPAPAPVVTPEPAPAPVATPEPAPAPVVAPEPAPAPVVAPEPAPAPIAAPAAKPEQPELVKEIYSAKNFRAITSLLTKKKTAGKVNWGNSQAMAGKTDKCIVVVLDRQTREVITVLGTGSTARINYSDGTICNDEQFANQSRIYVQEF